MNNTASQIFRIVRSACVLAAATMAMPAVWAQATPYPVSYTHLTLPTKA